MNMKILEWVGSICGVLGAIILALNTQFSWLGFVFFLVSSICIACFAVKASAKGILFMQIAFIAINIVGIYRWTT